MQKGQLPISWTNQVFTVQDCHVITDSIGTFGAGVSCSVAKLYPKMCVPTIKHVIEKNALE